MGNQQTRIFDVKNALHEYIQKGFLLDSLSKVTNISPENLIEISSTGCFDKEKVTENEFSYLNIFLSQLLEVSPRDEGYLFELIQSLVSYFHIPYEAIANYLDISASDLHNIFSTKNLAEIQKYSPETCHLYAVFTRDKHYSFL